MHHRHRDGRSELLIVGLLNDIRNALEHLVRIAELAFVLELVHHDSGPRREDLGHHTHDQLREPQARVRHVDVHVGLVEIHHPLTPLLARAVVLHRRIAQLLDVLEMFLDIPVSLDFVEQLHQVLEHRLSIEGVNDHRPIRLLVGMLGLKSQQPQRRRRPHRLRDTRREAIAHLDEPRLFLDLE